MTTRPVCLAIGGSDSCGGAGIQADLATFARAGVQGCSAITALTAQNPEQILAVEPASIDQLHAELQAIFGYYKVTAVKTGMLFDASHVRCVGEHLARHHADMPLVVDPVMVASSGKMLLDDDGVAAMAVSLLPLATLITPNLPEARILLGRVLTDPVEDATELAMRFQTSVLLKGGHTEEAESLTDILVDQSGEVHPFTHPKLAWSRAQSHGTGCRLAAAIAAKLANEYDLADSVDEAIRLLTETS